MRLSVLLIVILLSACETQQPMPADAPRQPRQPATSSAPEVRLPLEEPSVPLITGAPELKPVDEAAKDPSFAAFRAELADIVSSRDAARLETKIAPEIRYSFGDGGGKANFIREWKLKSGDTKLWDELERILALGGGFREGRFFAPYTYSAWPDAIDPFEHLASVCPDTVLRERPDVSAPAVVRLEWNVVKIGPDDPMRHGNRAPDWRQVLMPDGRKVWGESRCLRSHIDYRAGFARRGDKWVMELFVAGD